MVLCVTKISIAVREMFNTLFYSLYQCLEDVSMTKNATLHTKKSQCYLRTTKYLIEFKCLYTKAQ
jgi:hypothetical protein